MDKNNNRNGLIKILKYFNKLMFYGIILILISVVINLQVAEKNIYINVLISMLNNIGVALFIGAIFDISINSNGFTNYVADLLKDIIVSKKFLNDLTYKDKKQALEMILRPSGIQMEQCANIEAYFKKQIDKSMDMFHTNFKTNLVLNVTAKKEDSIVVVYLSLTYRIYKISNEYLPIVTTFDRNNCNIISTKILYSNGETIITEENCEPMPDRKVTQANTKQYKFDIPKELYQYENLTIKKEAVERGYDHWTNFHWNTLTPSDGIVFKLVCEDGLYIKEYFVFDDISLYRINQNSDDTIIDIVSTSWVDENTGFIFTISDTKSC